MMRPLSFRAAAASLIACLVACLVVCLAAAPAGAQASSERAQLTLRVPDSIAGFAFVQRKEFDTADEGVMLRYRRADGLMADVFVYPGPDLAARCDLACARDVIKGEGDEFIAAFPELIRMHYVDSIALAADRMLEPPAGTVWRLGRHLAFRERQEGESKWSEFYVYYLPGYRVKVRATYRPDSATARAIDAFAAAAAPAVAGGAEDPAPPRGIVITTTLAGSRAAVFRELAELLVRQGYTIADSSVATGLLVTAPRYRWPERSEKESWHGAESPGARLIVRLEASGDSTTVRVGGESPTRGGWTDAKAAEMLQMLSVMQFAAAMSPEEKKSAPAAEGGKPRKP